MNIINLINQKTCIKIGNHRLSLGEVAASAITLAAVARYANNILFAPESRLIAPNNASWEPRELTREQAFIKMSKNAEKAVKEHRKEHELHHRETNPYATLEEAFPKIPDIRPPATPLTYKLSAESQQSYRPTMEDAHFVKKIRQGILAGVFDGHYGRKTSQYAKERFEDAFENELEIKKGNVHQAFESFIHKVHQEVIEKKFPDGSTAVVCFIENGKNLVYTATLGDSEAHIYRTFGETLKSIPLSVVRDWGHEKEATRAAIAHGQTKARVKEWVAHSDKKRIYFFNNEGKGLNVSRSIGDQHLSTVNGKPGTIDKPKIAVFGPVKRNDLLVLSCDGLNDFLPEHTKIPLLQKREQNPARALAEAAMKTMHRSSCDNVTVLVLDFRASVG